MSINPNITMNQVTWFVVMLLGFVLAVFMGSAVGSADLSTVWIVLGVGIGVATSLALGAHYWVLIPLSLGATFPALPLAGRFLDFPEVAIAGCSLIFLLRIASRKEQLRVFRRVNIPILLFMAWVGLVFVLNPTGFASFGSATVGARFYFKLLLAFAAFLIMSNREYSERDMRWVFGFLIFGACFALIYGFGANVFIGPQVDPTTGLVADEFYTWHQLLAGPPLTITFLIFARWSPKQVFSLRHIGLSFLYLICILMVLVSGKRMAMLSIFIAPLVSAIVFKQFTYIIAALMIASASLTVVVAGHGQWFELPLVAQRTVSWLPGDWDQELSGLQGGGDDFRAELRRVALKAIENNPVIGKGFSIDIQDTLTAIGMGRFGGSAEIQAAGFALGRSWHNRWLGYAADFGIPLLVIQITIFIAVLALAIKNFRVLGNSNLLGVFSLYVFIYTCRDIIASHTSGHTANDAFDRWWMYGILVAIFIKCGSGKPKSIDKSGLPVLETRPDTKPKNVAISSSSFP